MIDIKDIKPYENNHKKHPESQLKQIADSLRVFGWRQPIVVDRNYVIIVGHGRYQAYLKHPDGIGEPWIEQAGDLTDEEVNTYRIADNRLNESDWDMDKLITDLKLLPDNMIDLTGFSKDLILESSEKDDDVPEIPEIPRSKLGDLYELPGGHKVLCGDCIKNEDITRLMSGERASMVFTDPPYNINYQGGIHGDGTQTKRRKILNDKMSSEEFYNFLYGFLKNVIDKVSGAFYICMSSSELHNLWKAFTDAGGHWQEYIIWAKNAFTLSRTDYQQQFEPIMYGLSSEMAEKADEGEGEVIMYGWTKHNWYGGRKQGNIWKFDRPTKSIEHPTMKPVMLCVKGIINSSKQGEIVLDTFLGSGSTLIAAEKAGRRCYGMELDPKYIDVIIERYCRYSGNRRIIKNGEEITWDEKNETNG